MYYFLDEDPKVTLAFWIGASTIGLALAMFLAIIVMHWIMTKREQRHIQKLTSWRKLLNQASKGQIQHLPTLAKDDVPEFVEAWNELHDAKPEKRETLHKIGLEVGLSDAAHHMLAGGLHHRAMAISALGHLGDVSDFDRLTPFFFDQNPIVSLCAARALSQIDPDKAMELFVPALQERTDWPVGTVANILKEKTHRKSASKALSHAILRANDGSVARLVRLLADTDPQRASVVIHQLLETQVDDHVTSTCLQVLTDRADIDCVRSLLTHPRWHVRMHAASALGRLGEGSDEQRLMALLSDPEWWVRYRAAQALRALPGTRDHEVYRLGKALQDVFAQDIIQQVLAEPLRRGTA